MHPEQSTDFAKKGGGESSPTKFKSLLDSLVGQTGTIAEASIVEDQFSFTITGAIDQVVFVEASTNLSNPDWTELETIP